MNSPTKIVRNQICKFRCEMPNGVEIVIALPSCVLKHLIVELGARNDIPTVFADCLLLFLGLEAE